MIEKPYIILDIAPHLHDFLYHDFERDLNTDAVILNTRSDIGKYINSMVSLSDMPVKLPEMQHPIKIILPVQEYNHYILTHNFLQVVSWRQQMLIDFLEAAWRTRVREYFITGREQGYSQDKIINGFLFAYNIKKNAFTYDQIKKIDYRNRRKVVKKVNEEIQRSLFE